MAVPQFVKLSPITFVSTARKHINQIVLTMAVISASLWSGLIRLADRIRAFLPLQSILPSHHLTSSILRLIYIFSVISKANLLGQLTVQVCFSYTSIINKICKEI